MNASRLTATLAAAGFACTLIGCGHSSGSTSAGPGPASTTTGPGSGIGSLKTQAAELDMLLGCPGATVTSGSGYAVGAAYVSDCDTPPTGGDVNYSTVSHYDITVWPDATSRDAYLQQLQDMGGFYVKGTTSRGGYFVVSAARSNLQRVAGLLHGAIV